MTETNPSPPAPVDGQIFRTSLIKTIKVLALNVFLFLLCLFLLWTGLTDQGQVVLGFVGREVSWWGILIGIVGAVAFPIIALLAIRTLWVKRRLIVASDRIQIVERRGGKDTVTVQIPYVNIAEYKFEVIDKDNRVGIDLLRLDDPDTYAISPKYFEINKAVDNRHLCISSGYREDPRTIGTAIEIALKKWTEKSGK